MVKNFVYLYKFAIISIVIVLFVHFIFTCFAIILLQCFLSKLILSKSKAFIIEYLLDLIIVIVVFIFKAMESY